MSFRYLKILEYDINNAQKRKLLYKLEDFFTKFDCCFLDFIFCRFCLLLCHVLVLAHKTIFFLINYRCTCQTGAIVSLSLPCLLEVIPRKYHH